MKLIKILSSAAVVAVVGLSANRVEAVSAEQLLNISLVGTYQGTNTTRAGVVSAHSMIVRITSPNIVKAIAVDYTSTNGIASNNIFGGTLIRKVGLGTNSSGETIIIRKGTNETDVTSFFGGSANNFSANNEVFASTVRTNTSPNVTNTFIAAGLHSISLNTSNITFTLNGYGLAVGRNVFGKEGTVTVSNRVDSLSANGTGLFSLNVGTNLFQPGSNVHSGPAYGTFKTSPAIFRKE
jgi:hypothetical protein